MAGLHAEAKRPDGAGDEQLAAAASRASRAILTPRELSRCTSSARPTGPSLKRLAPKVLVSMM